MVEDRRWKKCLKKYAKVMGQYINYEKHKIYFFNTMTCLKRKIENILGCQCVDLPVVYMELIEIVKEVTAFFQNSILERLQNTLTGWKEKLLSNVLNYNYLSHLSKVSRFTYYPCSKSL